MSMSGLLITSPPGYRNVFQKYPHLQQSRLAQHCDIKLQGQHCKWYECVLWSQTEKPVGNEGEIRLDVSRVSIYSLENFLNHQMCNICKQTISFKKKIVCEKLLSVASVT